ncbi:MAG: outer membrane beta-barrel protein [Ignavibacteriales bacterium]|nr:outer membrane beta-barrel protein [Ignavibacteriales bacterium]MCF8437407.1 outer membrane beta-barrel protein [Ignavibacteriales bacterium]
MLKIVSGIILSLLIVQSSFSQSLRSLSMGNVSNALIDEDNDLTPYNYAGNPAWLYNDEKVSWLRMIPSTNNSWGDYKKRFSPGRENNYNLAFKGIKTLGTDGTFLGETIYRFENRKGVSRSLTHDPYFGGAFFFTDTTRGDIKYDGPYVNFMYSFELLPGLQAGAAASYGILNGLKNIYTRSESHLREVGFNAGLAYQITDDFTFAANYALIDYQEKIVAESEDLLDVENFYYRGDTYSIMKRSGSVSDKIQRDIDHYSLQLHAIPFEKLEIAASGTLRNAVEMILIPYVKDNQSFKEFEEGEVRLYHYDLRASAKYYAYQDLTLGLNTEYALNKSWSKNPYRNLLLWEWDINQLTAGLGMSYNVTSDMLFSADYNIASLSGDSSKYIDSRYYSATSFDHNFKFGAEYEISRRISVRCGYNFSKIENDFVFGGKDATFNLFSVGASIEILDGYDLEFYSSFSSLKPSSGSINREWFDIVFALKVLNF